VARGGARPGAGRKPGTATEKTRDIANRAAAEGITPLEVMLYTMRDLWNGGDKLTACQVAKDCAPYVHPRLANIEATGKDGGPMVVEIIRYSAGQTS
jgi:hypothetical protein